MSDPIFRNDLDGYRFIYEEGTILIPKAPLDKLGRLSVDILTPAGAYLGRDMVNFRADSDRWRLSQQAGRRDGVTPEEWADRLLAVSVKLEQVAPQVGAGPTSDLDWPPLEELPLVAAPPTLPASMVPESLRGWLVDVASHACLPLEMPTIPALVSLGSVVGRRLGIRPNRFDDYTVVPNLWGDVIARSGAMKSYAIEEGLKPVKRLAVTAHDRFQAEVSLARARLLRLEAEIDGIKSAMKQAARGKKGADDMASLEVEMAEKLDALEAESPKERRYWTQDATIEKLQELLRDNPQGLLVSRDELAGWLREMDKPGREGAREFYLEAWNGTGSYFIDRIGRGTIFIPEVCLSVVGGIQPGKLQRYISEAMGEGGGADGMLQRLQLSVWIEHLGEWSPPDRWPDSHARIAAYAVFKTLAECDFRTLTGVGDTQAVVVDFDPLAPATAKPIQGAIPYLRFAPDAQEMSDVWRSQLENRIRGDELTGAPAFESHLAKYRSLMPSLALLFHLIDITVRVSDGAAFATFATPIPGHCPENSSGGEVSLEATQLAAAWCDFLEAHARRVYAAELSPGVDGAQTLAAKIQEGVITDGQSVRDIYQHHWAGLNTLPQVTAALCVLAEAHWVRIESLETGGRPTELVRLHPNLRGNRNA